MIKCKAATGAHMTRADRGKAPRVTWSTLETEDAGLAELIRELARGWGYCDSDDAKGTGGPPGICESPAGGNVSSAIPFPALGAAVASIQG